MYGDSVSVTIRSGEEAAFLAQALEQHLTAMIVRGEDSGAAYLACERLHERMLRLAPPGDIALTRFEVDQLEAAIETGARLIADPGGLAATLYATLEDARAKTALGSVVGGGAGAW